MTTEMNGLFAGNVATATNGGTLAGTQQLTNISATIAEAILISANNDLVTYGTAIASSQTDMVVLDKLISDLYDTTTVDVDFLKAIDDETIEGMLKSQQSKRSRCKSKEMTLDNYKSMMTAAIAEKLIRQAAGKDKGTMGGRAAGPVQYSPERLQKLADDQDALRKEIRNVQSKKSILKSKAGFSESDDRWLALLVAESQLKGIRVDGPATGTTVFVADQLRTQLQELLAEIDETVLNKKELVAFIQAIKVYVWPAEPEEEIVDEQAPEQNEQ